MTTSVQQLYEVTDTERGQGLTCPRKDCGGKFILNLARLRTIKAAAAIRAVTCPYCSRISKLPEDFWP